MAREVLDILIVDDEPPLREVLSMRLARWGYEVRTAGDVAEAERIFAERPAHVVLTDVVLPGRSGVDLLRSLRSAGRSVPVLLMTAHGSIDVAVEAMKEGARDFLTKPLDYHKLHVLLESCAAEREEERAARALESRLEGAGGAAGLVGESPPMLELRQMIELVAGSDASALITGESGTGKEVVARAVHASSARREQPFVAVNAAAIPEGLIESELFGHEKGAFTGAVQSRTGCFEQAHGGTLFLDEIGEMPVSLQPKLLRILEEGRVRRLGGSREVEFDVRVLAATNRDAAQAITEGRLREDLFYRLNVFELNVPALRDRMGDLPLLVQHFVRAFNQKHGTSVRGARESAIKRMRDYAWPGNVRELRNLMERAVIVAGGGWIEADHLPPYVGRTSGEKADVFTLPLGATAAEVEKRLILKTLELVGNNKAEAARRLGLDVKTIRNKLKSYAEEEELEE